MLAPSGTKVLANFSMEFKPEQLLRKYDFCIECLTHEQRTEDHIIAKGIAKSHPDVLLPIVQNRRNLAPFCRPHHIKLEVHKTRSHEQDGVSGLVVYLAERYPKSPRIDVMRLRNRQLAFLFTQIAGNITQLNGDAPRVYRSDYERALDKALTYADRLHC